MIPDRFAEFSWADIADWIVDLPGGKLYKISEIDKTKNKTEEKQMKNPA